MPDHRTYHDHEIVNPETQHEESDVNVRALLSFVIVFVVFAAVTHIALWMLFRYYRVLFRGNTNAPLSEISLPKDAAVPPEPRLQPFRSSDAKGVEIAPTAATPVADLENMRRAEETAQTTPGWIDQQQGRVRIPIETAKQLALQRGLYKLAAAPAPNTTGAAATPAGGATMTPPPASAATSTAGQTSTAPPAPAGAHQ